MIKHKAGFPFWETGLVFSYDFPIKWLLPFYPALFAQAASGVEKCMDDVFQRRCR